MCRSEFPVTLNGLWPVVPGQGLAVCDKDQEHTEDGSRGVCRTIGSTGSMTGFGHARLAGAPITKMMAEGARFETAAIAETIVPNRISSFQSQSLTEESEVGEEPIETDRAG